MRRSVCWILALWVAFAPAARAQTQPVDVIVNQIGSVPGRGVNMYEFKFAVIVVAPGIRAEATAAISGSKVTGLTIANAGAGYTKAPAVTISGGGGSGAKATATVSDGMVTALKLAEAGAHYTSVPTVTFSEPSGLDTTTLWSNDGTSVAGSEPAAAVTLQVVDSTYSALLGYTGLPNMAALPSSVLGYIDARVRVWHKTATGKVFLQIVPDSPLKTIPYAEQAGYAAMAATVPNGSITAAQIADGTITANQIASGTITGAQIAPGAIATPSGALLASYSPGDANLIGQGYVKVQSIPGQSWVASSVSGAPSVRSGHTAIWTGASMIAWGGTVSSTLSNQGGEYNAASASWFTLPTVNAPAARKGHTAVWTGSQMIVWGGETSANPGGDASGGVYNDANAAWQAMATSPLEPRTRHTAVWTGSSMIIWGGNSPNGAFGDGASYTPPTGPTDLGSWSSIPSFTVSQSHSAVWTGSVMIVWGGLDVNDNALNTGAAYDPGATAWTAISSANAPSPRYGHSAIWTGTQMIVFGGVSATSGGTLLNDGGIYDPSTDTWTALSSTGAPDPRMNHGAVWTGSEMLVFSGQGASGSLLSAGAYNPLTNLWRALPAAPALATQMAGVWSGLNLLSFGLGGLDTLDPSPTLYVYAKF